MVVAPENEQKGAGEGADTHAWRELVNLVNGLGWG